MQILRAIVVAVLLYANLNGVARSEQWEIGRPVQLSGSQLTLTSVTSPWAQDFDYAAGRPGGTYFNDCVIFVNRAAVRVTHVQFIFAAVDENGTPKRPSLPLDLYFGINPGARNNQAACREHGYANGDRGFWLVAWVNRVEFADGTSWVAPTGDALAAAIRAALPSS